MRKLFGNQTTIPIFALAMAWAGTIAAAGESWDFDSMQPGRPPTGWHSDDDGIAAWQVIAHDSAPSGGQVLSMVASQNGGFFSFFGSTFNIIWADTAFLNGEITVNFKAISGGTDQGGGIMWRVQDGGNYYVARFNPLEDNFRIYSVKDGSRSTLVSADVTLAPGWHSMKIVQNANAFTGYLDGKKLLAGIDDLFPGAGGVGLWTKADAVTSFDDLTIQP